MTMRLTVQRSAALSDAIPGQLRMDGEFFCYTLERLGVEITPGTYSVEMTYSPKFDRDMPLINGVHGRFAIRIHPGNEASDSDGCILVGYDRVGDTVLQSRQASDDLNGRIADANGVTIEVIPFLG